MVRRVKATIESHFGLSEIYPAGALFTRIWADELVPEDGMDVDPGHRYWNPHVDKANRASYDYSALLYLNSHCAQEEGATCRYDSTSFPDFNGGEGLYSILYTLYVMLDVLPRLHRR